MILNFAMSFAEMGLRKWQIFSVIVSVIVFPITFFISSKNFDAKSVYGSMIKGYKNKE
tara:strand:+ start:2980 stop:3153 length:174 start_codon:yes stop_codon:yes gene_type:complete